MSKKSESLFATTIRLEKKDMLLLQNIVEYLNTSPDVVDYTKIHQSDFLRDAVKKVMWDSIIYLKSQFEVRERRKVSYEEFLKLILKENYIPEYFIDIPFQDGGLFDIFTIPDGYSLELQKEYTKIIEENDL